jgi:hypothetical protein
MHVYHPSRQTTHAYLEYRGAVVPRLPRRGRVIEQRARLGRVRRAPGVLAAAAAAAAIPAAAAAAAVPPPARPAGAPAPAAAGHLFGTAVRAAFCRCKKSDPGQGVECVSVSARRRNAAAKQRAHPNAKRAAIACRPIGPARAVAAQYIVLTTHLLLSKLPRQCIEAFSARYSTRALEMAVSQALEALYSTPSFDEVFTYSTSVFATFPAS